VRFNLRAASLITRQVIEIRGGMVSAVLYRREITILRRGTLLDHSTVETFGKALSGFEKLVAAVNLLAKLDLLAHDPSLRNVISTIGGLAELLDTFETVRSMTSKWVRYGRELAEDGAPKAVELIAETGEVAAATGGRRFLMFLGEAVGKKLTPLAVVAGAAAHFSRSSILRAAARLRCIRLNDAARMEISSLPLTGSSGTSIWPLLISSARFANRLTGRTTVK